MAKSKTVTVRGRKYWRSAAELKPTWPVRRVELEVAETHFDASLRHHQRCVTELRDSAAEVSRAATRLTNARRTMKPARKAKQ
jgi:hypothetical protein